MDFRNYFLVLLAISIFFMSGNLEKVFAQEDAVPDWIRQVAIWWGEGQISTQEYLDSISFLIEDEVIEVPGFVKLAEGQEISTSEGDVWAAIGELQDKVDALETTKLSENFIKSVYVKEESFPVPIEQFGGRAELICELNDIALSASFSSNKNFDFFSFYPTFPDWSAPSNIRAEPPIGYVLQYVHSDRSITNQDFVKIHLVCFDVPWTAESADSISAGTDIPPLETDPRTSTSGFDDPETELRDTDGDGIPNSRDNCSGIENTDQADRDQDGIGDLCDRCPDDPYGDPDTDMYCAGPIFPRSMYGGNDNCPDVWNLDQKDSDGDGIGDACDSNQTRASPDSDGDGIYDSEDNCPKHVNRDQADSDRDGIGDVCDSNETRGSLDSDGDGIADNIDKCPNTPEDKNGYQDTDGCPDGRGS